MRQELVERQVHDLLATEPVVMEAKAVDAVGLGDVDLLTHHIGHTQVVVAQIGWQVGLVMPFVLGHGLGGEHVEEPGEGIARLPIKGLQRIPQSQLHGALAGTEARRIAETNTPVLQVLCLVGGKGRRRSTSSAGCASAMP